MIAQPIGFQDADFEYRFIRAESTDGRICKKWWPFGMPRLNPFFPSTVFFLFGRHPGSGETIGPLGTGVIVGVPTVWESGVFNPRHVRHFYAVTCQHVAPDGASIIRINTTDDRSRLIEFEPHEWQFIPSSDDLAAIDITDQLSDSDDVRSVPVDLLATHEFMANVEFGLGEDGFMLGLFGDLPGKDKNMVAARFGNVGLLADEAELIEQGNKNARPSHLFDMRSRPGFSGSPVFVYRTPDSDLRNITYGPREMRTSRESFSQRVAEMRQAHDLRQNTFLRLLGIHSAQYHDKVKAYKIATRNRSAEIGENGIRDGDTLRIPNSMCVVVPAWQISKLLCLPIFSAQRHKREEMDSESNSPEPESVVPSDASNPKHQEDFTRLLGAAATPKRSNGRTSRDATPGSSGGKKTR